MIRKLSKAEKKIVRKSVEELFERYRMFKFLRKPGNDFKPLIDAVEVLPTPEKHLIQTKYFNEESDYIPDYQVYLFHFDPPISHTTYMHMRDRALIKLALKFNLCPELNLLEDDESE